MFSVGFVLIFYRYTQMGGRIYLHMEGRQLLGTSMVRKLSTYEYCLLCIWCMHLLICVSASMKIKLQLSYYLLFNVSMVT